MIEKRLTCLEAAVKRARTVAAARGLAPTLLNAMEDRPVSAILLCRGGRLGSLVGAAGPGIETLCALNVGVAIEFLLSGNYDAAVIDAVSLAEATPDAIEQLRRQSQLADMPIIVVVPPFDTSRFIELGASATVLLGELRAALLALAPGYRRVVDLKRELRLMKAASIGDTISGLAGADYLDAHITAAIAAVEAPVALGTIHIALGGPSPGGMSRAVASLILNLTRAEDVVAELDPSRFAVLFCGIEGAEAHRVLDRLRAVVEQSAVLGHDGDEVLVPRVTQGLTEVAGFASTRELWQAI